MTDRRLHSRALGVAAVLTWATTIGYAMLLAQQDPIEPLAGRVVVVAATMLILGLAAALGAFMPRPTGRVVLAAVVVGGLLPLPFVLSFDAQAARRADHVLPVVGRLRLYRLRPAIRLLVVGALSR